MKSPKVLQAVSDLPKEYTLLEQGDTTVFPRTNEEKLIEFQGAIYELEEALRKLDEIQRREVAEKEAALAETLAMKKLAAYKIGDAYEIRGQEMQQAKEYPSCEFCGMNHKNCPL